MNWPQVVILDMYQPIIVSIATDIMLAMILNGLLKTKEKNSARQGGIIMSYGKGDQLERKLTIEMLCHAKTWKIRSRSTKYYKKVKHRRERQRVRLNPEAPTEYGKYNGWEW